jgi:hypothetical protein
MKSPHNYNLPSQTNDVMVNPQNPVNPDSKLAAARIISTKEWLLWVIPQLPIRQPLFHKSFLGFIMGVCGMPSSRYSSPAL